MTKYDARSLQFVQALKTLVEVMELYNHTDEMVMKVVLRDSAIQRFEYTAELAWKKIKDFLAERHEIFVVSPGDAFREAFRVGMIDNESLWSDIIQARNRASHIYNESMSQEVFSIIPESITVFQQLADYIG
jgi:nucleotidyltransferase substrate binding protein (TIGR01987 family)